MGSRRALRMTGALSLALFVALAATGDQAAVAAVRLCEAKVSSGLVTGSNEGTARAAALGLWKTKALTFGEPYGSWRIAAEKTLTCLRRQDGSFECIAMARPCTIEQAPDRRELRRKRQAI